MKTSKRFSWWRQSAWVTKNHCGENGIPRTRRMESNPTVQQAFQTTSFPPSRLRHFFLPLRSSI